MLLRRVTAEDIDQVAAFAIEGLRPNLYPLHLSREKVRQWIRHFADSQRDFHLAAFDGGRIVGLIAAIVQEMPFWERWEAHVLACRAVVPGVGQRLFRELFRWVRANPLIRRLHWAMEFDAEPRMMRIAERFGFNSFHTVADFYKV